METIDQLRERILKYAAEKGLDCTTTIKGHAYPVLQVELRFGDSWTGCFDLTRNGKGGWAIVRAFGELGVIKNHANRILEES